MSRESPPPQSYKTESANKSRGFLEAPGPRTWLYFLISPRLTVSSPGLRALGETLASVLGAEHTEFG
eukprot:191643-Pelagomonas_calceolata.AAC.1